LELLEEEFIGPFKIWETFLGILGGSMGLWSLVFPGNQKSPGPNLGPRWIFKFEDCTVLAGLSQNCAVGFNLIWGAITAFRFGPFLLQELRV